MADCLAKREAEGIYAVLGFAHIVLLSYYWSINESTWTLMTDKYQKTVGSLHTLINIAVNEFLRFSLLSFS